MVFEFNFNMKISSLFIFVFPFFLYSQSYIKDHTGMNAGVVLNFGSHINAIGLNLNAYYTDYFFQLNAGSTIYFYDKAYGGRKKFWEIRNSLGLVLLAGKRNTVRDFQFDGLNHQTSYDYGLAYNYLWYFDNVGTSQRSGGFGIHIKNISLYHENDVFAGSAEDRFRTGHFLISYKMENFKLGIGLAIWTGETIDGVKVNHVGPKMRKGYKSLEDRPYGKTSHGNAYASMITNLPYQQNAHLRIGMDNEHIRHSIQNRLIHDMLLLPAKMGRTSYHYPRLDKDGCPTFEKETVRPTKFYTQFGMNENWSN
jgi:hypothetical protein